MTLNASYLSMDSDSQNDDLFDFGFTAISEDEIEMDQHQDKLREAIDKLYTSVLPLLANLEKNPEKDYIYWPNRTSKIAEFRDKITSIYNSTK